MVLDEAVTLFLRAGGAEDTATEAARKKSIPVAKTLGCLALAIVQAGAYIRKGFCSIEEYCNVYSRLRQELLKHRPVQASSDYTYSVYTTWRSLSKRSRRCAARLRIILLNSSEYSFSSIMRALLKI